MKKKILLGVTTTAIFTTLGCSAATAANTSVTTFNDVAGHWAEQNIKKAVSDGYVDGFEDGTFKPEGNVSRAQFLKLVASALKVSLGSEGNNWYDKYVKALSSTGVYKEGDFVGGNLDSPITRSEMAKIVSRSVGEKSDVESKWMYLATKAGIIQGMTDKGDLGVSESMTRAQSVTVLYRVIDKKAGKSLPADKRAVSQAEVLWHGTNIESMLDGDYIDVAATPEKDRLDLTKAKAEAYKGNVKGWADGLYVIDLDDPNDPYRYLLDGAKVYYIDRSGAEVRAEYLDLPGKKAYVVVSVSTVSMKSNPDNLDLHYLGTSYLGGGSVFDYGSNKLYNSNGDVAKNVFLVFYENGKQVTSDGTTFKENTTETRMQARILPKLPGKHVTGIDLEYFKILFSHFSSFGQYPEVVGKYALHSSRK